MVIRKLKGNPFACLRLCWLIRTGKIKATPEVRERAKSATFGMAYGSGIQKMWSK